jgi:hypothetical protein
MKTVTKMRLSKETYAILKNFASINSNIIIKSGNTLKTKSPGGNMYVEAKVTEDFDVDVPIWDLNQFLGVSSLFTNPDLEFHDTHVVITNGRSSIEYYYAEPSLLDVPKKDIKMPKTIIKFDLEEKDLNEIYKAANILQVNDLKLVAEEGAIKVIVEDESKGSSNNFEIVINETHSGPDFEGIVEVSDLKLLPGAYTVELTDTILARFNHKTLDLSYYVAVKRN